MDKYENITIAKLFEMGFENIWVERFELGYFCRLTVGGLDGHAKTDTVEESIKKALISCSENVDKTEKAARLLKDILAA